MEPSNPLKDIAFVIPLEKFIYRDQGAWQITTPVGPKAIRDLLRMRGVSAEDIDSMFKRSNYLKIMSIDNVPNAPDLFFNPPGVLRLNTWRKPRLDPSPGPFPRIAAIIDWLCGHDPEGVRWLINWIAFKAQNPAAPPLTAVLFCGTPGSGKNTLSRVMREILGMENTADLNRQALESKFNARWIGGLFCYGDDCFTRENASDMNEKLKVLIASEKLELEGKGTNQREVQNRLAWMLSSNHVAPIVVEDKDRRYTVFNNFEVVKDTPYQKMVKSCFDVSQPDRLDPKFVEEIQGFWHHVLNEVQVDRHLVSTPYENAARLSIIEVNEEAHESFFKEVDLNSIDHFIEELQRSGDPAVVMDRDRWDFGADGVSTDIIYRAYRHYCESTGRRPLAKNRFCGNIQKHRPIWPGPIQKWIPGTDARTNIYRVKRSDVALKMYLDRKAERDKKETAHQKRKASAAA